MDFDPRDYDDSRDRHRHDQRSEIEPSRTRIERLKRFGNGRTPAVLR
jgi:hypothetical protein